MPTYTNNIIEVVRKNNDKGEYLEIKIQGKDKVYEKKVFGPAVEEITVPGEYECAIEKNSKGFNVITRAKLLSAAPQADSVSNVRPAYVSQPKDHYTDEAITAQVAMKAAAEITVEALTKATQPVTSKQAKEFVTDVMDGLLLSAKLSHEKEKIVEPIEDAPF